MSAAEADSKKDEKVEEATQSIGDLTSLAKKEILATAPPKA